MSQSPNSIPAFGGSNYGYWKARMCFFFKSIGESYTSIKDLRNSMVSLEKRVSDVKLIKKILRSLLERFRIKVNAIEESDDLDSMKIEELAGIWARRKDEKKDPRGPKCCGCSGFGHMRKDCRNLRQAMGKAYNATHSKSEEKETSDKDQKYLAFVAPHEQFEGSQSYYLESSDKEKE
jgi:glycerol-3-phosphate O-acyltransferase